jgi:hypothetical protein
LQIPVWPVRSYIGTMITPQCKAVITTLLALTLPGCGFPTPWASPSAIATNQSPEKRPFSPRNRVLASNQVPLDADEASITGSVLGDEAAPDKRAKNQASCDGRQAVSVGMTRAQVYASCWGKPTRTEASTVGRAHSEMLFYQGSNYVYLEDGVVINIQVASP